MKLKLLIVIILVVGGVFAVYQYVRDNQSPTSVSQTSNDTPTPPAPAKTESLPLIDLQSTIDAWAAKHTGTASVVVYDLANNKNVALLKPDRQYFTASIYKLYVAYAGYLRVTQGKDSLKDPYLGNLNRGQCLDKMIRESYSPCGEKMWAELGKTNLTNQLKTYGLKNTSMTGLYTSAQDAALILQRLFERHELNESTTNLFLDSLKSQPDLYRRGLPKGFAESTVYNKVGWNELVEWHDAAIVTLPNNRSYIVVILTEKIGTNNIRTLAKSIEAKLTE